MLGFIKTQVNQTKSFVEYPMFKRFDSKFLKPAHWLAGACAALMLLGAGVAQAQPSANYYALGCVEGARCYLATGVQAQDVAYGAAGGWSIRPGLTGTFICGDSKIFGGDPKPKTSKACYASYNPSQQHSFQWFENDTGTVPANTVVWYGVDGRYVPFTKSGQFKCGSGMGDPWKGRAKYCFVVNLW